MSQVGKTQLRGHGLLHEGEVAYDVWGRRVSSWPGPNDAIHAKCSCGALSPAGISKNAAKKWHREHKDTVRALSATLSDAQGERAHGDGTAAQGSLQGDSGGKR